MEVIDDFVPQEAFAILRAAVEAPAFRWQSGPVAKRGSTTLDDAENIQDIHGIYRRTGTEEFFSRQFGVLAPVLALLRPRALIRIKINRTQRRDRHVEFGLHVDTTVPGATTAILYLNTNNGYTLFESGERVASVANRIVIFDAALRHTGATCTDADHRLVVNINLLRLP